MTIKAPDYTEPLASPSPYAVLRTNRNFRLLYIGQTISQLGDWFNTVAVLALLLDLTGSATLVAAMIIVSFLPIALVGPVAGVVADRMNRRRLMIAADLVRGVLVLGLLLVDTVDQVWLAFVLVALTVTGTAFFEPARSATIPNVTTPEELLPANVLSSATWSAMLAIGASIGGLVTAVAGRDVAFGINALSFFASAFFISRTTYDATPHPAGDRTGWFSLTGIPDLTEGLRYVWSRAHVAALMCVKAGWGLAGGIVLLLTIFGQRVFPVYGSSAAGIGVLYGARGLGAALGPFGARWVLGQEPARLRRAIGPAYFVVGGFYVALGLMPTLPLASICVFFAHAGGSILWVFSTVLLQMEVPDRYRGRVFAVELALVTFTSSISSYFTGFGLDHEGWSPRTMAFVLGATFALPGTAWLAMLSRWGATGSLQEPASGPSAEEELLENRLV